LLITRNLESEFRQGQSLNVLRQAAANEGSGGTRYSYLTPDLVREPRMIETPLSRRVGAVVGAGTRAIDSDNLTNVEKRAITKSANSIMYSDPEMYGP